jgi:simple sugar transport system ATP-binding protein
MTEPTLTARGVTKRYGHVVALQGVDFDAYQGEVVALIGDNGAGKSTFVKIISGTLAMDEGEIRIDGAPVELGTPNAARRAGIETVYQDLALAMDLDTPSNLFLGRELRRSGILGSLGFLDKRAMRREALAAFQALGVRPGDPDRPVSFLSGGQSQSVAVARASAWAKRFVIMDEPTAALGHVQTERVLDLIRRVRDRGICVILISHNLPDVLKVADRIEVLRLGRRVAQFHANSTSLGEVVAAMTGMNE